MSFGLGKLKVDSAAVVYFSPDWLDGSIKMRPATSENAEYVSAMLSLDHEAAIKKLNHAQNRRDEQLIKSALKNLERVQNQVYKDVFPKHVFVGWENIQDENGNDVEFSVEAAKEFMEELSAYPREFNELIKFAGDPENFREVSSEKLAEELAGN